MTQLSLFDPIEIPLTRGYVAIVDPVDSDLAEYSWWAAPTKANANYAVRGFRPVIRMHRVILERIVGRPLTSKELCDHINCNPLDNRRSNLRIATNAQNCQNVRRTKQNKSGYKGVYWLNQRNGWIAQIGINNRNHWLGTFATPEAAYEAYCAAARELHGEFARLK